MINDRKTPIIIEKLSALLKRIPTTDLKRKEIEAHLARHKAGINGEHSLDYFFRYLPQNEITILNNIRIFHHEFYFQIDTLILTPQFFIILEIKNLAGHIYFDNNYAQVIRFVDGKKESFDDPIRQVQRQAYHLSETLKLHNLHFTPIETLVVIPNPKTLVESPPSHKEALSKVIKSADLLSKYEEFKLKHRKDIFTKKDIKKIIKLINKLHTPYNPDVCSLYSIKKEDLIKGVFCPKCEHYFLIRRQRSWFCGSCNKTYHDSHVSALKDYALLISIHITNSECKKFLNLQSNSQAYHILNSLNLPRTGTNKSRKYSLTPLLYE